MSVPDCPHGHGPMKHVTITDGNDRVLGCAWFCVLDNSEKPSDYCDECADCDCTPVDAPEPVQLSLLETDL